VRRAHAHTGAHGAPSAGKIVDAQGAVRGGADDEPRGVFCRHLHAPVVNSTGVRASGTGPARQK
jgi:hypothetical protein